MKLFSYECVLVLALSFTACDKKKDSTDEAPADAAISESDADCDKGEAGLHGDLTGYTASSQGVFNVKIEWSENLVAESLDNKAKVTILDSHAHALPLKISSFKLFMPSMGHGSSQGDKMIFTQDPEHKNIWNVEQIYFTMGGAAGDWVVNLEAAGCGVSDKATVAVPVEVQ